MFNSKHDVYLDLSGDLRESGDWQVGPLRNIEYLLDAVSFAIEPLSGLLAVGTIGGVIHIFGGPGVQSRLTLPEPLRIKLLQFSVSVFKLICVDEHDQLHIWDLNTYGRPKLQKSTRFDGPINSLTVSASHTHLFVALQSGEIKTYDLICLRKSPYAIPNMWKLYEQQMAASGMPETPNPGSQIPVEVAVHPRDLNLVFVAYSGGVVLSDMTARNTVRAYELVIPAGAPGGAGYGHPELLSHRRPPVTCLAIHPAGHFFAVGYADGTVAFWAVEDEDHPLFVRTIDDLEEVNLVDGDKIEQYLPSGKGPTQSHERSPDREPVFKISWSGFKNSSDPRGGETALTVLGGMLPGDGSGVNVLWLPPFNPPEPPAASGVHKGLHPFLRKAMRESLFPTKSYFYNTAGPTQDFLLVPKESPHFACAFDPLAILLLSDAVGDTRALDGFQYPPPEFLAFSTTVEDTGPADEAELRHTSDVLSEDLASTLEAMTMTDDPKALKMPPPMRTGNGGVDHAEIIKLELEAYETFTSTNTVDDLGLSLKGGIARVDESTASEAKLSKYQPHRILVTHHRDRTIQFQDISAQLLVRGGVSVVDKDFPDTLPAFTIELDLLLTDGSVMTNMPPQFVSNAAVASVHLATESLECAVVFKTGEVVMYRLDSSPQSDATFREAEDQELVIVEHVPRHKNRKYHPYFFLAPSLGPVSTCALSDIGFLAVAYADGSLVIVDMRGPNIIYRSSHEKTKHKRVSLHIGKHTENDKVVSLAWAVCGTGADPKLKVRLLVSRSSGLAQVISLGRSSGSSYWVIDGEALETETLPSPIPHGSFVIDANNGAPLKADRRGLSATLQGDNHSQCLWITAGAKGVRSTINITGERVGKADWNTKAGAVESVQIVEKNGSHALVAFTDKNQALVYSLPHLEFMHTLQLPESDIALSVDTTGDFIAFKRDHKSGLIKEAILCSLFNIRRAYGLPDVDFATSSREVPNPPQPVSAGPQSLLSGAASWFGVTGGLTGEQVDALLAGPDRPLPEPPKVQPAARSASPSQAARMNAQMQSAQGSLYNRLASAVSERGQALGDLEDSFNSLESGSKSMVDQAKRLAAEQSAKSWFKFS